MPRKRIHVVVIVGVLFGVFAAGAQAARPEAMNPAGKIRGVVPAHGQASRLAGTNSNLSYHGGPVMRTNKVYAIYWAPSSNPISSSYESLINRYFTDVALDSGLSSNVYWSDTQYSDTSGPIAYNSSFAGQILDTDKFPANGCRDRYTKVCLSDAQIQTEISHVVGSSLPRGLGTEYFVFTPKGVGSCAGNACAFSYYCAYHSQMNSGANTILYANMPYAMTEPTRCGSGQSPNGNDADSTLSVTSHEHNETITDPLGTAWYDNSGNENGDKCAWNFGSASGSSGAEYNQTINNDPYYLQQEWSNASSGCVLTGI